MLNENYKIVIVGVNEKQKKELPSNILSIIKTNNTIELAEIYSAADIFLNPTLEDNFPTTNLEALACETPIITFDTGGSGECIIDNNCGVLIKKKDTDEIVKNIYNLSNNIKLKKLRVIRNKYNKDNKYMEYKNIYLKLLYRS